LRWIKGERRLHVGTALAEPSCNRQLARKLLACIRILTNNCEHLCAGALRGRFAVVLPGHMDLHYQLTTRSAATAPQDFCVHVVDNNAAARKELELCIRSAGWLPRMAACAEEFLARPRVLAPSCLLLELDLPGIGGLELQKLIAARSEMPVIFMSSQPDVRIAVRAIKAGAIEFLTKPLARDALLQTVRQAMEVSEGALRHLAQIVALQQRYESLSRREREVMNLVVAGRLNKQVGGELGISEITVKAHRGKLMRKMHATSLAELVTMAASLGQCAFPFTS